LINQFAQDKQSLISVEDYQFLFREIEAIPWRVGRAVGEVDPTSVAIRLHIANKELWDQYDRMEAEAELRLALAIPLVSCAVGVALRGTWWAGAAVLALALVMFRVGDNRARAANGVLIQCIATQVVAEPLLDRTKERLGELESALRPLFEDDDSSQISSYPQSRSQARGRSVERPDDRVVTVDLADVPTASARSHAAMTRLRAIGEEGESEPRSAGGRGTSSRHAQWRK